MERYIAIDAGLLVYSVPQAHIWHQTGHLGWLTNWSNLDRVPDSMVLIPAEGDPVLLFSGLPYVLAQVAEVSWMRDIRIVRSFDPNAADIRPSSKTSQCGAIRDFAGEVSVIINERGLGDKPVGLVGIENRTDKISYKRKRRISLR